jgi:hypothetical protein
MRHTPFLGRRTTVVAMATAALAVAALAGVALSGPSDPPPAVAATPSASAQADVAAGGDTSPRTTPARVAYLGDSYTVGTGATTAADGWVSLLDDVFGWRGMNLGCGGSGYVSPGGSCGKTYDERIADVVASRPDAVVVSGGLNDARNTDDLNELKLEICVPRCPMPRSSPCRRSGARDGRRRRSRSWGRWWRRPSRRSTGPSSTSVNRSTPGRIS